MGQLTGYYVDDRLDSNYEIIVRENILDNMVNRKKGKDIIPVGYSQTYENTISYLRRISTPFFLT